MKFTSREIVFLTIGFSFVMFTLTSLALWGVRFHLIHGHYFDEYFKLP